MSRIAYTKQLYNKGQVMTEYTQVPNKLITLKIPPAEKAVLLVIARFTYGYQRTQCELSISQIADHASISRRSAFNIIAALENNGFLSVVRGKADGINTMNSYQIIDLYSGAEFAPPSANNSLGVVQNLHSGSAEFAPSKESIKENINNIPPIVPPQGETSTLLLETIEPKTEVDQLAKPVVKKTKPAQPKTLEEVDIANLENPLPLQKSWMQDPRIKQAFTDVLADYELQATPTLWRFIAGGFVDYWTGLDPRTKKAKKVDWVATFRNWTRKAANDNQWRWKKDQSTPSHNSASVWSAPMEMTEEFAQELQELYIEGKRKRGEI